MWQKKRNRTLSDLPVFRCWILLKVHPCTGWFCSQAPKSCPHCQTFTQQWNHGRPALMSVRTRFGWGFSKCSLPLHQLPTVYLCQPANRTALLAALRLPPNTCEQWLPPHEAAETLLSFFWWEWHQSTSFSSWRHDSLWAAGLKHHKIFRPNPFPLSFPFLLIIGWMWPSLAMSSCTHLHPSFGSSEGNGEYVDTCECSGKT